MRTNLALVLVVLLSGCGNNGRAPGLPADKRPLQGDFAETLGAEYRRLRAIRGHFNGAQWNDDVDQYGGRKQAVMNELGTGLGTPGTPRVQVSRTMGEPDEIARPGDELWSYAVGGSPTEASEMLVYHWRGRHDFLYFLVRDDHVLASGWWMAYD